MTAPKPGSIVEVQRPEDAQIVSRSTDVGSTVALLLQKAVEMNLDVEKLGKLVDLQERILDRDAEMQFHDAMAEFQKECPPIPKDSAARDVNKPGAPVLYRYAELDTIARIVNPILTRLGLSYTWDSKVDEKSALSCTCTVRHKAGHSRASTFTCQVSGTNMMSAAQKAAGTLTYAMRQSLRQALGLTTTDPDDDGAERSVEAITPDQVAKIDEILVQLDPEARAGFLRWRGVKQVAEIRASDYAVCMQTLDRKLRERLQ